MRNRSLLLLCVFVSFSLWANADTSKRADKKQSQEAEWSALLSEYLAKAQADSFLYVPQLRAEVDTLYKKRGIHINFTEEFAYHALRERDLEDIDLQIRKELGLPKRAKLHITVDDLPFEQYVPVYYSQKKDKERRSKAYKGQANVRNTSKPYLPSAGLNQRHIALWNSHGRYYKHTEERWKWQRAPLFTTVEDLFTSAYILPFLVPMLENAGANVYLPRERDVQTHEVIVDDDDAGFLVKGDYNVFEERGFKNDVLLDASAINPFKEGGAITLGKNAQALWRPVIPADGTYAIYISYVSNAKSSDEASYTVHHSGGSTHFSVNQQMGGGTWIYLGHFFLEKGDDAYVTLDGSKKALVSADAVRFGGGMGDIPRQGELSGSPRWQEAARYFLQYSGVNDTLVFNRHGDSIDYNDDFRCRARWVNYLLGGDHIEPSLSQGADIDGFGIPIDLSFGLHTDAGHFPSMDTTVGTLAIYSTYDVDKNRSFYNGISRLSNRDFTDIMQSQVVNDLRILHDEEWTKRELWDKMYSEATFATVPSMLLELHAHSNAQDMRYGLDPQFRFDASRSMYKAMLRFLAIYNDQDYVVQPLPVSNVSISEQGGKWLLRWQPTVDSLEPSATPTSYVVYSRVNGKAWDNGTLVDDTNYELNVTDGLLYSYKVTAVNEGGESFPSTVLSASKVRDDAPIVLVVDGFSRVSAPFFMESGDSVGVAPWLDEGVAWGDDIATIGWQYGYDQQIPWRSDDIPGHGSSSFELVDSIFVGNDFDNSRSHVLAIANAGYNVITTSMAALERGAVSLSDYDAVDFAFGEQRTTVLPSGKTKFDIYTPRLMRIVESYLKNDDARLLISGAHIAGETLVDTSAQLMCDRLFFANMTLGYASGGVVSDDHNSIFVGADSLAFRYNTAYSQEQYRVEHADVLLPYGDDADVLMTYFRNEGAVVFNSPSYRVLSAGFPFESILTEEARGDFMKKCLEKLFNE